MGETTVGPQTQAADALAEAETSLREHGWCVVPDVLTADQVALGKDLLWKAAEAQAAAGVSASHLDPNDRNVRVYNLPAVDRYFIDLLEHPAALALVRSVLDTPELVSNFTANIALPGSRAMRIRPIRLWWSQAVGAALGDQHHLVPRRRTRSERRHSLSARQSSLQSKGRPARRRGGQDAGILGGGRFDDRDGRPGVAYLRVECHRRRAARDAVRLLLGGLSATADELVDDPAAEDHRSDVERDQDAVRNQRQRQHANRRGIDAIERTVSPGHSRSISAMRSAYHRPHRRIVLLSFRSAGNHGTSRVSISATHAGFDAFSNSTEKRVVSRCPVELGSSERNSAYARSLPSAGTVVGNRTLFSP